MKHANIYDMPTYLRLCGRPHNRKYAVRNTTLAAKLGATQEGDCRAMACGGRTDVERPNGHALAFVLLFFVGLSLLPGSAPAQAPGSEPPSPPTSAQQQRGWYVLGRVTTLTGSPLPGAQVTVYIGSSAKPTIELSTSFQGEFEISLDASLGKNQRVRVVIKQDGYHDATETIDIPLDAKPSVIDLVLREKQEDESPENLSLGTLIASVTKSLRGFAKPPTAKAEPSETVRGAEALLNPHDPDARPQLLEKAAEREPKSVELRTLEGLAMLEAGSWSSATRQLTEAATLNASLDVKSRRPEPDLILGVLESWRGNPQRAAHLFLRALEADAHNPLVLQELGRAYLLERNWSGAEKYLALALQAGALPEAHLLRAQALLGEAKPRDTVAELQTYLGGRKPKDLPKPVRMMWVKLNLRLELETESETANSKSLVKQTPAELLQALPQLKGLELAKDQGELSAILQNVGERVEGFFRDFHNTTSQEQVRQEILHRNGKVGSFLTQNFDYWLLSYPDASQPVLEEYRTEGKGPQPPAEAGREDFMLTKGFASASHFLLPAYQPESAFSLLGRQRMGGHETYVVAFAQRPEVARLQVSFRHRGTVSRALSQGLVWVDSETYQITRMQTELLNPLAKAQLDRLTTEIEYGEVHFQDAPYSVRLPRDVVVTMEWKGKLRRNRHNYSDFHLFSVEAEIKAVKAP